MHTRTLPTQPTARRAAAVATQYPAVTLTVTFYLDGARPEDLQQELHAKAEQFAEQVKQERRPQQVISGHLVQLIH